MFGDVDEWISREVGGWVDGVWLEGRTDGWMDRQDQQQRFR